MGTTLSTLVRERRVGFRVTETMRGTHTFEPGQGPPGEHPNSFTARWGSPHLFTRWLNPFSEHYMTGDMRGTVTVGGLCEEAELRGSIELRYLRGARIVYRFRFRRGDDTYRFYGEKNRLRPWNLHRTHRTLHGRLHRDGGQDTLVSRSVLYFRWSELPSMLGSFRLA